MNHKNFIAIRDIVLDVMRDEDELDYELAEKITSNICDFLDKKINF